MAYHHRSILLSLCLMSTFVGCSETSTDSLPELEQPPLVQEEVETTSPSETPLEELPQVVLPEEVVLYFQSLHAVLEQFEVNLSKVSESSLDLMLDPSNQDLMALYCENMIEIADVLEDIGLVEAPEEYRERHALYAASCTEMASIYRSLEALHQAGGSYDEGDSLRESLLAAFNQMEAAFFDLVEG